MHLVNAGSNPLNGLHDPLKMSTVVGKLQPELLRSQGWRLLASPLLPAIGRGWSGATMVVHDCSPSSGAQMVDVICSEWGHRGWGLKPGSPGSRHLPCQRSWEAERLGFVERVRVSDFHKQNLAFLPIRPPSPAPAVAEGLSYFYFDSSICKAGCGYWGLSQLLLTKSNP